MLGLIARADNRGLGQQTWAFQRNMRPEKTLVVNCPSQQPLPLHLDRYPGATVVNGLPTRRDIEEFLDGLDTVYTAETAYGPHLWDVAEERGVKTVLHANYEFWNGDDRPSVFAVPTVWHWKDLPKSAIHLPVPIETDRLTVGERPAVAKRFLHIVGRPAIHDRNGTPDLLEALEYVQSDVSVTIACQQRGYVEDLLREYRIPDYVEVDVRATDTVNYWENYLDADALIMPRRFGGLCLPAQEAIGCGIPVIMPDISPNDSWLPFEWLVPADKVDVFMAKRPITYYQADVQQLAVTIDAFAGNEDFYRWSCSEAEQLRGELSWETMLDFYNSVMR